MAHVSGGGSEIADFTGGLTEFDVVADTVGRLYRALDEAFPGLGEFVQQKMALAIDGEIHQNAFSEPLAPNAQVFLIPKIGGG
jgi:molybdopterin synthase sulfur carrier subunit